MTKLEIPAILTVNTYFWRPGGSASSRRYNEKRHLQAVADFFQALGFDEVWHTSVVVEGSGHGLHVRFEYSESCKNVYKRLTVEKNGKRSNISAIKKLVKEMENAQ